MKKVLVLLTLALTLFLFAGCTSDEINPNNKQNNEVVSSSISDNSEEKKNESNDDGTDDNAEASNNTSTGIDGSYSGDGWTNQY